MARIIADFGRQRVIREGGVIYALVYRLDCGCSMEADERELMLSQDHRMLMSEAAILHRCGIIFTPKVYDPMLERSMTRWDGDGPTYMGVPISGPERAMREFWPEVRLPVREPWPLVGARVSTNPLGFKPEQLDALKTKPELKKPEPKDRFDLIEID